MSIFLLIGDKPEFYGDVRLKKSLLQNNLEEYS